MSGEGVRLLSGCCQEALPVGLPRGLCLASNAYLLLSPSFTRTPCAYAGAYVSYADMCVWVCVLEIIQLAAIFMCKVLLQCVKWGI